MDSPHNSTPHSLNSNSLFPSYFIDERAQIKSNNIQYSTTEESTRSKARKSRQAKSLRYLTPNRKATYIPVSQIANFLRVGKVVHLKGPQQGAQLRSSGRTLTEDFNRNSSQFSLSATTYKEHINQNSERRRYGTLYSQQTGTIPDITTFSVPPFQTGKRVVPQSKTVDYIKLRDEPQSPHDKSSIAVPPPSIEKLRRVLIADDDAPPVRPKLRLDYSFSCKKHQAFRSGEVKTVENWSSDKKHSRSSSIRPRSKEKVFATYYKPTQNSIQRFPSTIKMLLSQKQGKRSSKSYLKYIKQANIGKPVDEYLKKASNINGEQCYMLLRSYNLIPRSSKMTVYQQAVRYNQKIEKFLCF